MNLHKWVFVAVFPFDRIIRLRSALRQKRKLRHIVAEYDRAVIGWVNTAFHNYTTIHFTEINVQRYDWAMSHDKQPKGEQTDMPQHRDLSAVVSERAHQLNDEMRWLFIDNTELNQVLDALARTEITGADVIGYVYVPTASGGTMIDHRGEIAATSPLRVDDLLEGIADSGMMSEFPNNFKIRLILRADESHMVTVDYESDEEPEICESCEPDHLNDQHSCDHGMDRCSSSYCVAFGPVASADEIDSLLVWF